MSQAGFHPDIYSLVKDYIAKVKPRPPTKAITQPTFPLSSVISPPMEEDVEEPAQKEK